MSIFTKKWYFLAKNDDFCEKSAIFLKHEKSILSLNFYWIRPRISINILQVGVKNLNTGILKIVALFRASKLKNGIFWQVLYFHSPTRTR